MRRVTAPPFFFMNIKLLTNPIKLLTADANLIVLGNQASVTFNIPAAVDVVYLPCKDYYSDYISCDSELFCTLDVDAIFSMYGICQDYRDLFIWDAHGLKNSWGVLAGLSCYQAPALTEAFNQCAFDYPAIAPSSLWFIEVFDLALSLDGQLIKLAEEYLATNQIITVGNTFRGQWS
jgi:hypothetical protein